MNFTFKGCLQENVFLYPLNSIFHISNRHNIEKKKKTKQIARPGLIWFIFMVRHFHFEPYDSQKKVFLDDRTRKYFALTKLNTVLSKFFGSHTEI